MTTDGHYPTRGELHAEIDALRARVAELEKDSIEFQRQRDELAAAMYAERVQRSVRRPAPPLACVHGTFGVCAACNVEHGDTP